MTYIARDEYIINTIVDDFRARSPKKKKTNPRRFRERGRLSRRANDANVLRNGGAFPSAEVSLSFKGRVSVDANFVVRRDPAPLSYVRRRGRLIARVAARFISCRRRSDDAIYALYMYIHIGVYVRRAIALLMNSAVRIDSERPGAKGNGG